jgi:SsrA-binding protein
LGLTSWSNLNLFQECIVPRERGQKVVATNRKARHDYHIEDVLEAGIVLRGTEVKSLRAGRASLVDGFASIEGGEVWLENVHIPEYDQGTWTNRLEIDKLSGKVRESGFTLIPLSLYFKDGNAKVELALAKGKREYDKRQTLREQQDKREAARAMSTKGKEW